MVMRIVVVLTVALCGLFWLIGPGVQPACAWYSQTVDGVGDVGWDTSIAVDASGYPHISYYDYTNGNLKYASWNGSTWAIQTVDSGLYLFVYSSLALDSSGRPCISYYDYWNGFLKYAAWTGSTWSIQLVDTSGDVGWYSSLALDASDYPHISYGSLG